MWSIYDWIYNFVDVPVILSYCFRLIRGLEVKYFKHGTMGTSLHSLVHGFWLKVLWVTVVRRFILLLLWLYCCGLSAAAAYLWLVTSANFLLIFFVEFHDLSEHQRIRLTISIPKTRALKMTFPFSFLVEGILTFQWWKFPTYNNEPRLKQLVASSHLYQ